MGKKLVGELGKPSKTRRKSLQVAEQTFVAPQKTHTDALFDYGKILIRPYVRGFGLPSKANRPADYTTP